MTTDKPPDPKPTADELLSIRAAQHEAVEGWKEWHRGIARMLGCEVVERNVTREAIQALSTRLKAAESEAEAFRRGEAIAWEALGKPDGTYETTNVERLAIHLREMKGELTRAGLRCRKMEFERDDARDEILKLSGKTKHGAAGAKSDVGGSSSGDPATPGTPVPLANPSGANPEPCASYGVTKAECRQMARMLDEIAERIEQGLLVPWSEREGGT